MIRMLALLVPLLVVGCGSPKDVGGVSPAEAEALNQAAEQLDRQAPPPRIEQPAQPAAK